MKLRNKKTGEIVEAWSFYYGEKSISIKYFTDDGQTNLEYYSLNELNEEWEDYTPKEPLIKNHTEREAIKAWAKASHLVEFKIAVDDIEEEWYQIDGRIDGSTDTYSITFQGAISGTEAGRKYTLEELCGEEEE